MRKIIDIVLKYKAWGLLILLIVVGLLVKGATTVTDNIASILDKHNEYNNSYCYQELGITKKEMKQDDYNLFLYTATSYIENKGFREDIIIADISTFTDEFSDIPVVYSPQAGAAFIYVTGYKTMQVMNLPIWYGITEDNKIVKYPNVLQILSNFGYTNADAIASRDMLIDDAMRLNYLTRTEDTAGFKMFFK